MRPKVLPPWFLPLTRYKYGLGLRPKDAPKIVKPRYQWVLDEWSKFDAWHVWQAHGGVRPSGIWRSVPLWAWTIQRELGRKQHLDPKPVPVFHSVPSKTAGKAGLYFYTYTNAVVQEARLIELCVKHGLWVALLVHELDRAPTPAYDTEAQRKRLQNAGITVVASGWVEAGYDLAKQAQAAAYFSQGFDEYMANAEASWGYGQPGFVASREFAPQLRSNLGANTPLSLSLMFREVIDLKPWLDAGLSCVRVQVYPNEFPGQNTVEAVKVLRMPQAELPRGIPAEMVDPTYGSYGDKLRRAGMYLPMHLAGRALGVRAASMWAGEFVPEEDYPVVASFHV